MNIRSITCFLNPGWPVDSTIMRQVGQFIHAARQAFAEAGFTVQTARMAIIPFPTLAPASDWNGLAIQMEKAALDAGFDYVSLGPALPGQPQSYTAIPEMLSATQTAFLSGLMTLPGQPVLSMPAVRACAEVIRRVATISPDGFGNLRFSALANAPAGTPFFPSAYHSGGEPAFALALEAADLAVTAFSQAGAILEARERLIQLVEQEANRLEVVCRSLATTWPVSYSGLDFTLAPFPEESRSIGTALERLGVPAIGLAGTLAAAAILAEGLDRAHYHRVGFNGLMFVLLEDATLASRAAQGLLTVNDLLLYSTVCGTGLDTLPLPGDTSTDQLAAILFDVATLALRLDKPLTARLMPVPGKVAGELTSFEFDYFANSRILALPASSLAGPMAGSDVFELLSRHSMFH